MSTRATYQFDDKYAARATVYIHYDGYPEGAASYFYRLLCHKNQRGCMATRIIRAVDNAELTGSHDSHSDTEYRYDITGSGPGATICALNREHGWKDSEPENWAPVYGSPETLAAFIDQYLKADWVTDIGGYHPFKQVSFGHQVAWMNERTARDTLNDARGSSLGTLRIWAKGGRMTAREANWRSLSESVIQLAQAFGFDEVVAEVAELTASLPISIQGPLVGTYEKTT